MRLTRSAPARPAVEYMIHRFESAFYNQTEYMGYPTPELDARWSNLTKCISLFRLGTFPSPLNTLI
jgi:hypothetical protein